MRYANPEKKAISHNVTRRCRKRRLPKAALLLLAMAFAMLAAYAEPAQEPLNFQQQSKTPDEWRDVEEAMGAPGMLQPDGVFKFSLPRSDLKVTVGDVQIRPALALGTWVAFKRIDDTKMHHEAVVMGDLVLTTDEVHPVMLQLQEGGIEQTALHNHVLDESPRVMYMHIHAHGDAVQMAAAIRAALDLTGTPFPKAFNGPRSGDLDLDTKELDRIIGHSGRVNGGVYQYSIPRAEKIIDGKMVIPRSMGLTTAVNFQPTGKGNAAITGDFVLIASEVNPVIRALRNNDINVTALHSHMLTEEPRLLFVHFWANDDAIELARGLREALDETNSEEGEAK